MPDFAQPPPVRWACTHVRTGAAKQVLTLGVRLSSAARGLGNAWPDEVECCQACAERVLRVVLAVVGAKQ